ncbi:MAG TPA: antiterminator LoaP [Rectinemataceae bacterium]|nr:antiterminator LoaP [Rectinemataceae bacterium]
MNHYAIHVLTGNEDDYIKKLRPLLGGKRLFAPKRMLAIRRHGATRKRLAPIFPGYVFLECEDLIADLDTYWAARRTAGFIRFLRDNSSPQPLSDRDRDLLLHFMSFGEYADTSKVSFDEHDKIVVLDGPLKGLEGMIVKVDRRRGRAKVALSLYDTGRLIDFGFEAVERITGRGGQENEVS